MTKQSRHDSTEFKIEPTPAKPKRCHPTSHTKAGQRWPDKSQPKPSAQSSPTSTKASSAPITRLGLVTPDTDPDAGAKKSYAYDPHLDPQLHWAGKAEHTSFEVPTVSLHVHERIDPLTIVEAVRRAPDPVGGSGPVRRCTSPLWR